jgi:hypothetical protein
LLCRKRQRDLFSGILPPQPPEAKKVKNPGPASGPQGLQPGCRLLELQLGEREEQVFIAGMGYPRIVCVCLRLFLQDNLEPRTVNLKKDVF